MSPPNTIAERYELGDRLGLGGMSTVHLAYDRRLERHVAVKLLAEHLADDPQFVSRFRREAQAAAGLAHPNVVQVFDFGLDEASDRYYIVMERIVGLSCAEILRDRGRLPLDEVLEIVQHACRGLGYAHDNGVVHRDVKPGNLLRADESGVVKVADFGIAKNLADESSITQVGSVLGTAAYLAPEQATGEEAGPRADLYALGVVTYQLVSGRLPYEAQSLTELALKQQREAPPLLHEIVTGLPPEFAAAVDRALALDPRDRHQDAETMRIALDQGAHGIGDATAMTQRLDATGATRALQPATAQHGQAPVAARQPLPPRHAPSAAPPAALPAPRRRSGARRALTVLLLLIVAGAAAAAVIVSTSDDEGAVRLRNVVYEQASQIADELEQLIQDNTQ